MPEATLVLNQLLPLNTVGLGYLALYPKDPAHDSYRPEANSFSDDDVITQRLENFSHILNRTTGSRLHAFLSSAIHSTFSNRNVFGIDISSVLCVTRQLRNSEDIFQKICALSSARRWLERALRKRQKVYLVVGIKTLTDAHVIQGKSRALEADASVEIPTALAAAAGGVVLPLGDFLDVGAGLSGQKQDDEKVSFVAPGEQIFAVQYRKIEFARFLGRDIDKASLELGNSWKVYVEARGREEATEEVVNAKVCEYTPKTDMDRVSFESFDLEDEELYYPF
ncbi:hypothetical protein GGP41_002857 [Bipolaris sorokiniana]|uniref:Uncharacterized protein n=2 Tax=Cochliobolus sativus TaxID=45130 RepID=A0A8H6DR13_COCSA|nr:uncharacterized protein COCSADRAFT_315695 [Bipolaris sorokiniana ND90Pr]EMD64885.1 hypothetical protein COCSADRAFT_315695 [Bipolaris sorokiniana ND90Pr]KAF5845266.1 hypothetical protein GGP41_002857 [Bipolaris sorokiniana]